MTDKFKVGERVRVIGGIFKGRVTQVIAQRTWQFNIDGERLFVYELDIYSHKVAHCGATEKNLAPLYDGYEKTTWDECYWKPKLETV